MAQCVASSLVSRGCPANVAADVDAALAKVETSKPGAFNVTALLKLMTDLLTQNWAAIPADLLALFLPTPTPTPAPTAP